MAREMLRAQVRRAFPPYFHRLLACACSNAARCMPLGDKDSAEKDSAASDAQQADAPESGCRHQEAGWPPMACSSAGCLILPRNSTRISSAIIQRHAQRTPALYGAGGSVQLSAETIMKKAALLLRRELCATKALLRRDEAPRRCSVTVNGPAKDYDASLAAF